MAAGPLMLDIAGIELSAEDRELLSHPQVGGLILFAANYESPEQLVALVKDIRACRPEIFIAVDQEGGRVQRFRDGFTRLPPAGAFGRLYATQPGAAVRAAQACGWLMAAELRAHDIDFSFAPVLDLDHGRSGIIADRAFAADPEQVIALAGAFLAGMHAAGMPGTGKHFPGHGWVVPDSHLELPVDERSLDTLLACDMLPFERLMADGLDAMMPAHIVFEQVDHHPVGFSPRWLRDVLRREMRFEGVIFSDDLSMKGACQVGDMAERVRAAVYAGCDMVLVCNDRPGVVVALDYLQRHPAAENPRLQVLRAAVSGGGADALHTGEAESARRCAAELCA